MGLTLALVAVAGYLVGGFPSGALWARLGTGRDLTRQGSGHTGGMNALRVAGPWVAGLTIVCDLAKGVIALQLGRSISSSPWAVPVAGVAAVAGHNWSPYLGLKGGMGLTTMAGMALWLQPLAAVAVTMAWGVVFLAVRHRPRATVLAVPLAGPVLWLLRAPWPVIVLGIGGSLLVAVKHVPDLERHYQPGEL